MTNRENGVGYDRGPFALEALSNEAVLRQAPITPFGDLESPFAWTPEREDEREDERDGRQDSPMSSAREAPEAFEASPDDARCPHCGRELDEAPDDHETPLLGEDSEHEGYLGMAEAFSEEAYRDAEWDDHELEHVDRLFEAEAEFASLSPSELKAVRITSTFETGHAGGFGGLTGNFDGQGLSFGLMNWTINAGSLIPLLQEFITKHADHYARIFGGDAARFKAMVFATRLDPKSKQQVRDVAAQMDFVRGKMNDASQKNIVEPWKKYFGGLENDPEFRAIEVAAARRSLAHAKRWFDRFRWKTERGFVFMFDLVSSHGAYWLDAQKFKGGREKLLAERTAKKRAELGREPNELETMQILANLIADVSLEKWRDAVRRRKLWFVNGSDTLHGSHYDLAKDFGVTDRAADFGGTDRTTIAGVGTTSAQPTAFDELATVYSAISRGETDPSKLTNLVFFARHPELGGRAIRKGETAFADEWNAILRDIVRPSLPKSGGGPSTPARVSSPSPAPSASSSTTTEVLGVDTSVGWHQEGKAWKADSFTHDWAAAKAHGIEFAIPRACEGTTHDPAFAKDWTDMKAAGIVRGGYLFLRFPHPKRTKPPSPEAQAKELVKVLDAVGLDEGDLPPVLDVEFPGVTDPTTGNTTMGGLQATGMTRDALLAGVRAAWQVLKDRYKVAPLIYTSYQVWLDNMPAPAHDAATDLTESPLWVTPYYVTRHLAPLLDPAKVAAQKFPIRSWYPAPWKAGPRHDPPVPPPWGDGGNWWIHQYQGDALHFPGFSGDIDMNRFHTMMPGDTGDRVKWVQRRLGISQTGTFDTSMESALRSFRTKKGLTSDAVVDPATFARLCWVQV